MKDTWSPQVAHRLREAQLSPPTAEALRPAAEQAVARAAQRVAQAGGAGRLSVTVSGPQLRVEASGPRARTLLSQARRELARARPAMAAAVHREALRALRGH